MPIPTGFATYLTAPNDTLETIAQRMGSEPALIASLNHIDAKVPLRAKRALVIPVYQAGEPGAGGLVINRGNPAEPKKRMNTIGWRPLAAPQRRSVCASEKES